MLNYQRVEVNESNFLAKPLNYASPKVFPCDPNISLHKKNPSGKPSLFSPDMDLGARSSSAIYVKINKFLQKKRRRPSKITFKQKKLYKSTSVALERNLKNVEKGSMVHLDMNFPSSTLGRRVSLDEWMFVQPLQDLMFFGRECWENMHQSERMWAN